MYPTGPAAYDRAITVFSPDGRLFQVEYAREAVKRGTTAVGLTYDKGVILAVDKNVVSPLIVPKSIEKIFKILRDLLMLLEEIKLLNLSLKMLRLIYLSF